MANIDIIISDSDMDFIRSGEAVAAFVFSGKNPRDAVDISLFHMDMEDSNEREMLKQTLLSFIEKLEEIA